MTERLVYTVEEVKELLGIGIHQVYNGLRAGQIPAVQIGTRWLIPKARFHEWLDGGNAIAGAPDAKTDEHDVD